MNVAQEGNFRLYEDEGDGDADGNWTTLTLEHEGDRVHLTCKGGPKRPETLLVYGHGDRAPYPVELRDNWRTLTRSE